MIMREDEEFGACKCSDALMKQPPTYHCKNLKVALTLLWLFKLQLEYTTSCKCIKETIIELWATCLLKPPPTSYLRNSNTWPLRNVCFKYSNSSNFPLINNKFSSSRTKLLWPQCYKINIMYYILPLHSSLMRRNSNNGYTITSWKLYIPKLSCICWHTCRRRLLEARLLKVKSHATSMLLFLIKRALVHRLKPPLLNIGYAILIQLMLA